MGSRIRVPLGSHDSVFSMASHVIFSSLQVKKAGSYTQAAGKYRGDVIPETRVRVQTGGHGGQTLLKIPSLSFSPVDSDHILVLFSSRH